MFEIKIHQNEMGKKKNPRKQSFHDKYSSWALTELSVTQRKLHLLLNAFFYSKVQDTTSLKTRVTEETGVSGCFLRTAFNQERYLSYIPNTEGAVWSYLKRLGHSSFGAQALCVHSRVTYTTACLFSLRIL